MNLFIQNLKKTYKIHQHKISKIIMFVTINSLVIIVTINLIIFTEVKFCIKIRNVIDHV